MEVCSQCGISGKKVKLFLGIYRGKAEYVCERCAIIENIPLVKKPTSSQLKEAEKSYTVEERIKRLAGIREGKKENTFFIDDKLKEIEEKEKKGEKEKEIPELVDHFHWIIMKNRRRKGLSQKQLAEALGESEIAIQLIENGKIPENSESLITKLEQFFQIRLRKISEVERILMEKKRPPVLLDEEGNPLDKIPEPELKERPAEIEEPEKASPETPQKEKEEEEEIVFDLEKVDPTKIKIQDLRELHERKIKVEDREKKKKERAEFQKALEELRKEEEKKRLIEKRKAELKSLAEKHTKEIDNILGGTELLKKEKEESFGEEDFREFEKELE